MSVLRSAMASRKTGLPALIFVLLLALAVRLILLAGPPGEIEADEAIVGLMGRHILEGERPVFYYMQPYMGSLEAYLAACSFALFGSSPLALKLVPMVGSLVFVGLIYATGYRLGGPLVALSSGIYAALPPAFLAVWGLKARGGYIETLVLGQFLIILALVVSKTGRISPRAGVLLGLLSGLGTWTNPLILTYLLPVALYLGLTLRRRVLGPWVIPAAAAAVLGAAPLLAFNLREGFATAGAMMGGDAPLTEVPTYLYRLLRYSLPVLAGLSEGSSSQALFWPAFRASPGGSPLVASLLAGLYLLLVAVQIPHVARLLRGREEGGRGWVLLSLLLVVVPSVFLLSKFRELITEPRYLLPIYAAAPLLVAGVASHRALARRGAVLLLVGLLAINIYSLAAQRPELGLPDTAMGSTASTRATLAEFLLVNGLDRIYTDYWIAYPLAFESQERIVPSVVSGGFNRYIPYAYLVSVAPNPAYVFVTGSPGDREFARRMSERGVRMNVDEVSVYTVYSALTPPEAARP